jgi:hypothetical protein
VFSLWTIQVQLDRSLLGEIVPSVAIEGVGHHQKVGAAVEGENKQ